MSKYKRGTLTSFYDMNGIPIKVGDILTEPDGDVIITIVSPKSYKFDNDDKLRDLSKFDLSNMSIITPDKVEITDITDEPIKSRLKDFNDEELLEEIRKRGFYKPKTLKDFSDNAIKFELQERGYRGKLIKQVDLEI